MKIVLINPPLQTPSSPPLGIGYLKSYLMANLDVDVKNIDLNLEFFDRLYKISGQSKDNSEISLAFKLFLGEEKDLFFNKKIYEKLAQVYLNKEKKLLPYIEQNCMKIIKGTGDAKEFEQDFLSLFVKMIIDEKPDLVGFSQSYSAQMYLGLTLAKRLKEIKPGIKIVFGGNEATRKEKGLLRISKGLVDYVMYGEGEIGFLKLVDTIMKKGDISSVPNLIYFDDGEIKINPASRIEDLDSLPEPDFSDYDLSRYFSPEAVLPVLTSRGCYWRKCAFCIHHKTYGDSYRVRDIHKVADEIQHHYQKGIRYFHLPDEMISAKRLYQISEEIVSRGMKISFRASAKPTDEYDDKTLAMIAKAGCIMLSWGLESANQRVLDLMNKGTKIKDMEKVLKCSNAHGIRNHVFVVVGFPTETKEEWQETLDFLEKNKASIDMVSLSYFILLEGCPVFESPGKYGIKNVYKIKGMFDYSYLMVDPENALTQEESKKLFQKAMHEQKMNDRLGWIFCHMRDHAQIIYAQERKE